MRAAKADANQPQIVDALRKLGCTVQHLHMIGKGCPDIAVGWQGKTYLLEIKDGSKKPSDQALTEAEANWHRDWRGHVATVNSVKAALEAIGILFRGEIS